MSNTDIPKITAAQFDEQIAALKNAASTTIDPCLVAKFIAASDSRVRELFLQKIAAGYVFRGIYCVDRIGIPENKYVVFDFDCAPGTLCLVPPAFMVVVNIVDRYVVAIVDPYIPFSGTTTAALSGLDGGVEITNVHADGDKICADIKVWAEASAFGRSWDWDKTWNNTCIEVGHPCYDLFSGGVGPASVTVEVCYESGEICVKLKVSVFDFSDSWRKCKGIGRSRSSSGCSGCEK